MQSSGGRTHLLGVVPCNHNNNIQKQWRGGGGSPTLKNSHLAGLMQHVSRLSKKELKFISIKIKFVMYTYQKNSVTK